MRLIGGNISDSPVKEIGDGSAFNVGGTVAAPTLSTFGTGSSQGSAISGMNNIYPFQPRHYCNIKWADNSFGHFWIDRYTPWEIWYQHLETNADGTLASVGSAVDVQAIAFTTPSGSARPYWSALEVKKLSASRITIQYGRPGNPNQVQWATFDKNSDTLTQHGSTLTYNTRNNNVNAYIGFGMVVVNSTTVLGIFADQDTSTAQSLHPVTAAGTLAKGTSVDTGSIQSTQTWQSASQSMGWTDSSGVSWFAGLGNWSATSAAGANVNMIKATVTPGSTPSVVVNSTITGLTPYQLACFTSTGDLGVGGVGSQSRYQVNRDDVEVGRCIWIAGTTVKSLVIFGGGTNPRIILREIYKFSGNIANLDSMYTLLEVSYDEDTYWGKYILCNGADDDASVAYIPFAFNWSSLELVQPVTGTDDASNTNVTPQSANRIRADLLGSSTATNLLNISDEAHDGVPSTMPVVL